jgi:hypothetical protein
MSFTPVLSIDIWKPRCVSIWSVSVHIIYNWCTTVHYQYKCIDKKNLRYTLQLLIIFCYSKNPLNTPLLIIEVS